MDIKFLQTKWFSEQNNDVVCDEVFADIEKITEHLDDAMEELKKQGGALSNQSSILHMRSVLYTHKEELKKIWSESIHAQYNSHIRRRLDIWLWGYLEFRKMTLDKIATLLVSRPMTVQKPDLPDRPIIDTPIYHPKTIPKLVIPSIADTFTESVLVLNEEDIPAFESRINQPLPQRPSAVKPKLPKLRTRFRKRYINVIVALVLFAYVSSVVIRVNLHNLQKSVKVTTPVTKPVQEPPKLPEPPPVVQPVMPSTPPPPNIDEIKNKIKPAHEIWLKYEKIRNEKKS